MKRILTFITSAALFTACGPARMGLDGNEWTTLKPLPVTGKRGLFTKEKLQFGDFRTTSVKRSWTKGHSSRWGLGLGSVTDYDYTNLISLEYIKRKQTVRFSGTDNYNNQSEVFCVSQFRTKDLTIGNRPNSILNIGLDLAMMKNTSSSYYVQLYMKEKEHPWEMLVDNIRSQRSPGSYTGYLSFSREAWYSIHPVNKMEDKNGKAAPVLFGSVGFEFRNREGKPVAAVSLIDKGMVYLQPLSPGERFLLANACAALLIQDQLG